MAELLTDAVGRFVWTEERTQAAILLGKGYNFSEAGREVGLDRSTVSRWMKNDEFAEAVDKLSLMHGLASKAERMRIMQRAVREFVSEDKIDVSGFTLLDLIKEARMQMEGVRIGILNELTALEEEAGSMAGSGSEGSIFLPEPGNTETD
jgi:hypothetical protein